MRLLKKIPTLFLENFVLLSAEPQLTTKEFLEMPILKTIQSRFSLVGRSALFIWGGSEGPRRTENHKLKVFDREPAVFALITKMYSSRVSSLRSASLKTAHHC